MKNAYLTQQELHNPDATMPLIIPVLVMSNTPAYQLASNIQINSARDELRWLNQEPFHDGIAVLVGGGPSAQDCLDDIRRLKDAGATVFAMNAASKWLRDNGVQADYQVIVDAQEKTATLVDPQAKAHLFGSQVHPSVMNAVPAPIVWHLGTDDIENLFPESRVKRGGYSLVGGGASVGNCAVCVAYTMGFQNFHLFGYDSSNREGRTHAYPQEMNRFIPNVTVEWGDRVFNTSVVMKSQAEWFRIIARELVSLGCKIELYGDGLLPTMWRTTPENMTERDKYRTIWQFDSYRAHAPGEGLVPIVMERAKKPGPVIDFGCGTGRASLALHQAGWHVKLVDFANNCRDDEADALPFLDWDLTRPGMPWRAPYGMCADVMEHIPPEDVDAVIRNIMGAVDTCFFQISTKPDVMGALIGCPLHLSVHDATSWRLRFKSLGFVVEWSEESSVDARFIVSRTPSDGKV